MILMILVLVIPLLLWMKCTLLSKRLLEISSHSIPDNFDRSVGSYLILFPCRESFFSLLNDANRCRIGNKSLIAL